MTDPVTKLKSWGKDPEFQSLPEKTKHKTFDNYFNQEIADKEFKGLDPQIQKQTKQNMYKSVIKQTKAKSEPETQSTSESETQEKAGMFDAFIQGIQDFPEQTYETAKDIWKGGQYDTSDPEGELKYRLDNYRSPGKKQEWTEKYSDKGTFSALDMAQAMRSAPYTLVNAGVGLGAGGLASLIPVVGGPAAWTTGTVATAESAFKATKEGFIQDYFDVVNSISREKYGRDIKPKEWQAFYQEVEDKGTETGLWEALPEAIGGAIGFGTIIGKLNKFLPSNVVARLASQFGVMQVDELAQETTTQYGQGAARAEVGLRKERPSLVESAKEVAPQTILLTSLLFGFGKGIKTPLDLADRKTNKDSLGKKVDQLLDEGYMESDEAENLKKQIKKGNQEAAQQGIQKAISNEQKRFIAQKADTLVSAGWMDKEPADDIKTRVMRDELSVEGADRILQKHVVRNKADSILSRGIADKEEIEKIIQGLDQETSDPYQVDQELSALLKGKQDGELKYNLNILVEQGIMSPEQADSIQAQVNEGQLDPVQAHDQMLDMLRQKQGQGDERNLGQEIRESVDQGIVSRQEANELLSRVQSGDLSVDQAGQMLDEKTLSFDWVKDQQQEQEGEPLGLPEGGQSQPPAPSGPAGQSGGQAQAAPKGVLPLDEQGAKKEAARVQRDAEEQKNQADPQRLAAIQQSQNRAEQAFLQQMDRRLNRQIKNMGLAPEQAEQAKQELAQQFFDTRDESFQKANFEKKIKQLDGFLAAVIEEGRSGEQEGGRSGEQRVVSGEQEGEQGGQRAEIGDQEEEISTNFEDILQEARRWQGALRNAEQVFADDNKARYQIAKQNNKSNLDKYLMEKFGIDQNQARDVSNTLTKQNLAPDDAVAIEDFRGQPWADAALRKKETMEEEVTQAESRKEPWEMTREEFEEQKKALSGQLTTKNSVQRLDASIEELASDYKAKGYGRQESWSRFVQDRNLQPEVDAKDFYKTWDEAQPKLLEGEKKTRKFQPTHYDPKQQEYVQADDKGTHYKLLFEDGTSGSTPKKYFNLIPLDDHKTLVQQALTEEGKIVPDEVLKDYPDLQQDEVSNVDQATQEADVKPTEEQNLQVAYKQAQEELNRIRPTIKEGNKLTPKSSEILMNVHPLSNTDVVVTQLSAPYDGTEEDALRVAQALKLYAGENFEASMRQSEIFGTDKEGEPIYVFIQGEGRTELQRLNQKSEQDSKDNFKNKVERGYTELPEDLANQVRQRVEQADKILKDRERKGLLNDTRSPLWLNEVKDIASMDVMVGRYGEIKVKVERGDKRTKPERLEEILDQLRKGVQKKLPEPLQVEDAPEGEISRHPTASTSDPKGRLITNIHEDNGVRLGLVWTYDNSEPSYWKAQITKNGVTGEAMGLDLEEVKQEARKDVEENKQRSDWLKENVFNRQDLENLSNRNVRTIAFVRNIDNYQNKKIGSLIEDILSLQDGDTSVLAPKPSDFLKTPLKREELMQKKIPELLALYRSFNLSRPNKKKKENLVDGLIKAQEVSYSDLEAKKKDQPWMMSRSGFIDWAKKNHPDDQIREFADAPLVFDPESIPGRFIDDARQGMVKQAIRSDWEVPDWVLDDIGLETAQADKDTKGNVIPEEVNVKPDGSPYLRKEHLKFVIKNQKNKGIQAEAVEYAPGAWGWREIEQGSGKVEEEVESSIKSARKTNKSPVRVKANGPLMNLYKVVFNDGRVLEDVPGKTREEAFTEAQKRFKQETTVEQHTKSAIEEPWKFTLADYLNRTEGSGPLRAQRSQMHQDAVQQAVSEGKTVPKKVLDEYPELQPQKVETPVEPQQQTMPEVGQFVRLSNGNVGKVTKVLDDEFDVNDGVNQYLDQQEYQPATQEEWESDLKKRAKQLRDISKQKRQEAAEWNKQTGGEAVKRKNQVEHFKSQRYGGVDILPFTENTRSQKHRELLSEADDALSRAKKLEDSLPKKKRTQKTKQRAELKITGSYPLYDLNNFSPGVLEDLGFKGIKMKPGQPQKFFGITKDNEQVDLYAGDIKGLTEHINKKLEAKQYVKQMETPVETPVEPQPSYGENKDKIRSVLLDMDTNNRIRISDVKEQLPDMPKELFDQTLLDMQNTDQDVVLMRLDDPQQITKADQEAAIDILGNKRHILYADQQSLKEKKEAKENGQTETEGQGPGETGQPAGQPGGPGLGEYGRGPNERSASQGHGIGSERRSAVIGGQVSVVHPGGEEAARYALMEYGDIETSHLPLNDFSKNPDYDAVNERAYHTNQNERNKVLNNALKFNSSFLLTDNPDATNGAPIVTSDGTVLGGNSRAMTLELVYSRYPDKAKDYIDNLKKKAELFGLTKEQVESMDNPVLVRKLESEDLNDQEKARLVHNLNQDFKADLDSRSEGISKAKFISSDTMSVLADGLQSFDTLRQYLDSSQSKEFIDCLLADGALEETQLNSLMEYEQLTTQGKDYIERMLRGTVVTNYDLLNNLPRSIVDMVDRVIPSSAKVQARGGAWDITGKFEDALRMYHKYKTSKLTGLETFFRQATFTEDKAKQSRIVRILTYALENMNKTEFQKAWASYSKKAMATQGGEQVLPGMEKSYTPEQSLRAFKTESTPEALFKKTGPQYSKNKSMESGLQSSEIQDVVDEISKRWTNSPKINVVQSEQELPWEIVADIKSKDVEGEIEGIYWEDEVYLVADNISSTARAEWVLFHESFGHYGLDGIMDKAELDEALDAAYLNEDVRNKTEELAPGYEFDLNDQQQKRQAVNEALSNMAADGVQNKALDRFIAKVREWIRKVFPNLKMSDAEIRDLVGKSRQYVGAGQEYNSADIVKEKGEQYVPAQYTLSESGVSDSDSQTTFGSGVQGYTEVYVPEWSGKAKVQESGEIFLTESEIGPVKVGSFKTNLKRINDVQDAAAVLRPLGNEAQENFVVLILDKNNKPLTILKHSIGGPQQSQVYPNALFGAIHNFPKANKIYTAHNHPSGSLVPSGLGDEYGDVNLVRHLESALKDTGVDLVANLIISPSKKATVYYGSKDYKQIEPTQKKGKQVQESLIKGGPIKTDTKALSIPITVRKFKNLDENIENKPTFNNPKSVQKFLNNYIPDATGVLFVDNQSRPLAWVPMTYEEMGKLRTNKSGTGASRLWQIMDKVNAGRIFLRVPDTVNMQQGIPENIENMINFATATRLDFLDALNSKTSINVEGLYNFRNDEDQSKKYNEPFYSRQRKQLDQQTEPVHQLRNTKSQAFQKWFGDSKVVDENGKPLVVYHGTSVEFSEFSAKEMNKRSGTAWGSGFYFTADTGDAQYWAKKGTFAKEDTKIMPVYLSLQNPLVFEDGNIPHKIQDLDRKYYQEKGHDGLIYKIDGNIHHAVAWSPAQIKSVYNQGTWDKSNPDINFSAESAPTFYSQMLSVIQDKLPNKGAPKQMLMQIKNWARKGLFKQEEYDWSGIETWLSEQEGKVSKEQVLDYLRANQIQVKEVTKGQNRDIEAEIRESIAEDFQTKSDFEDFYGEEEWAEMVEPHLTNFWENMSDEEQSVFGDYKDFQNDYELKYSIDEILPQSVLEQAYTEFRNNVFTTQEDAIEHYDSNDTKYSEYQIPGGKNYQELLLTLPSIPIDSSSWTVEEHGEFAGQYEYTVYNANKEKVGRFLSTDKDAAIQQAARHKSQDQKNYRSSHWDKPNVLAHVRFDERTDADGNRVLFVNEVQSDWHQEGGKEGYEGDYEVSLGQAADNSWFIHKKRKDDTSGSVGHILEPGIASYELAEKKLKDWQQKPLGIPNAPFKTTWPQLAMKRMLRYATENGFDKVAWPGSAEQIAIIEKWGDVSKEDSGKWLLDSGKDVTPIVNRYLQDIPRFFNKYAKKWGAKVETTKIKTDDIRAGSGRTVREIAADLYGTTDIMSLTEEQSAEINGIARTEEQAHAFGQGALSIPVTDQMRQAVLTKGQPLFSASDSSLTNPHQIKTDEDLVRYIISKPGKYGLREETDLATNLKENLNEDEIDTLIEDGIIPDNWEELPQKTYEIGEELEPSRTWDLGSPIQSHESGASAISLNEDDINRASQRMIMRGDNFIEKAFYAVESYGWGNIYVLRSDEIYSGEDPGEIIMEEPVVVGIIQPDGISIYGEYDEETDEYIPKKILTKDQSLFNASDSSLTTPRSPLTASSSSSNVETWLRPIQDSSSRVLPIRVVQSMADLPEHIKKAAGKLKGRPKAVIDRNNGEIIFIADNIADQKDAVLQWIHEQAGHYGFERMLDGNTIKHVLSSIQLIYGRSGLQDLIDIYGDDMSVVAREKFARIAEKVYNDQGLDRKERTVWQKFVDAVRNWLRGKGLDISLSEREIADMARAAIEYSKTGQTPEQTQNLQSAIKKGEQARGAEGLVPAEASYGPEAGLVQAQASMAFDFAAESFRPDSQLGLDWSSLSDRQRLGVQKEVARQVRQNGRDNRFETAWDVSRQDLSDILEPVDSRAAEIVSGLSDEDLSQFLRYALGRTVPGWTDLSPKSWQEANQDFQQAIQERLLQAVDAYVTSRPERKAGTSKMISVLNRSEPRGSVVSAEAIKPIKDSDRRSRMIEDIEKSLNVPIRTGRFRQKVAGIYKEKPEVIRTAKANDVEVAVHEAGHHLQKLLGLPGHMPYEVRRLAYPNAESPSKEGFAEFVRFYVTQPEYAKNQALNFYTSFENILSNHPDVQAMLARVRQSWNEQMAATPVQRVMSVIDPPQTKEPLKERLSKTIESLYTATIDELEPLRKTSKRAEEMLGRKLKPSEDPFMWAWMQRGWAKKASQYIRYGQFQLDDNGVSFVGPSLKSILQHIEEAGERKQFEAYLVSRRALADERVLDGFKGTLSSQDFQQTYDALNERYKEVADQLDEYSDNLLRYLVGSGRMSEETYQKIKKANPFYVPLYRIMDIDSESRGSGGKNYGNINDPIKRLQGSSRDIESPLANIIRNTFMIMNAAERNRVGRSLIDLSKIEGMGDEVEKLPPRMQPVKMTTEEALDSLRKQVEDLEGVESADDLVNQMGIDPDDLPDMLLTFRPNYRVKGNEVVLYNNGQPEVYELSDELYRVVMDMDSESMGIITRILSAPAQALRAGATLAPEFGGRNIGRDTVEAGLYSKYGYVPVIDVMRGLFHVLGKTETYQKFNAIGAGHSDIVTMDRNYLKESIKSLMGSQEKPFIRMVKAPWHALQVVSQVSEELSRVAEMSRGLHREGETLDGLLRSGHAARDLVLDFQRSGSKVKSMKRVTAFWGARMQGGNKFYREYIKEPKLSTYIKSIGYLTLPSILLWFAQKDDPCYQEVPQWRKMLAWNIVTHKEDDSCGTIWSLPKPFTPGILFGSLPEEILNFAYHSDPDGINKAFTELLKSFYPGIIPTAAVPAIEWWGNRSLFFDRPIVSYGDRSLDPELQYHEWTSETVKKLAEGMAHIPLLKKVASPAKIENTIRDYTGGMGKHALDAVDALLTKTGLVDTPPDPSMTLSDLPMVKGFVQRMPTAGTRSIEELYKRYAEANQEYESMRERAGLRGMSEELDIETSRPVKLRFYEKVAGTMTKYRKYAALIASSRTLSPQKKRQHLDTIYTFMTNLARSSLGKKPIPMKGQKFKEVNLDVYKELKQERERIFNENTK